MNTGLATAARRLAAATAVGALADADLFAEAFFLLAGLTGVAGVVFVFLPERGTVAETDELTDA